MNGQARGGVAVIMLTEEALEDPGIGELMDCLRSQPAWSDIPVLLFADAERSEIYLRTLRLLEGLRNVVLLERPIRHGSALSLIRSAIRHARPGRLRVDARHPRACGG